MKIAIDCRMSGLSGIGVYLDNLLEIILSESRNNSYLLIGNENRLRQYEHLPYCEILHSDLSIFSFKEMFLFPVKDINKCDVFYSPNYNIPAGVKIPVFSTIHDIVFLDVDGLTSVIGKFIRKLFLWRAIKISKVIFTVSVFSKKRINYHFNTKKPIVVTYNSIRSNLKKFSSSNQSAFDFPYIVYVGNIKKHKGLGNLLEAYTTIDNKNFHHKLVIIGSADNFKTKDVAINKLIKSQNNSNIIFTGKIDDEQLYTVLTHASLLVQPSIYEGFGIPPLEALYLRCNALVSDIPVFHEIYDDLPVTFFDINNIDDLKDKITSCVKNSKAVDVKNKIDEKYNTHNTVNLILNSMYSHINCLQEN